MSDITTKIASEHPTVEKEFDFVLHYGRTGRVYSQIYSTKHECITQMKNLIAEFAKSGIWVHGSYVRVLSLD